jgi:hypothetical protein
VAARRVTERQKRINKAKEIAMKKAEGKKLKGKLDPALLMAYAFEEALADYHYRPTMKFIKNRTLDPSKKSTQYFTQAARLATAAGADFGDFVRAQFYWFHVWFGRDCRTHELRSKKGTFSAIERYRQWMKLRGEGKVPSKVTATSVSLATPSDQEVDKINLIRLDRLCELWDLDPRRAIIAFAPEGIFDQDWLDRNPTYRQLRAEGRL